jgi:hypothetical protein
LDVIGAPLQYALLVRIGSKSLVMENTPAYCLQAYIKHSKASSHWLKAPLFIFYSVIFFPFFGNFLLKNFAQSKLIMIFSCHINLFSMQLTRSKLARLSPTKNAVS